MCVSFACVCVSLCACVCVCVHLEGFQERVQIGDPPGRSIFTFSSPFCNKEHVPGTLHKHTVYTVHIINIM